MGKQLDFRRSELRIPKELWKKFALKCKRAKLSFNAAITALVAEAVEGDVEFERKRVPSYCVVRKHNVRDVMAGDSAARGAG